MNGGIEDAEQVEMLANPENAPLTWRLWSVHAPGLPGLRQVADPREFILVHLSCTE